GLAIAVEVGHYFVIRDNARVEVCLRKGGCAGSRRSGVQEHAYEVTREIDADDVGPPVAVEVAKLDVRPLSLKCNRDGRVESRCGTVDVGDVRQVEQDRLVRLIEKVAADRNADRFADLARREGHDAGGGCVILPSDSGAIGRTVGDHGGQVQVAAPRDRIGQV